MENLLTLIAVSLPLMGTPGPVTLASAAAGAAYGSRAATLYVACMTLGTFTVISLVATGLTGLVLAVPGIAPVLAIGAGLYVLYLAWKIATAPPLDETRAGAHPPALWGGYAMAIMNPKAYAAFVAIFSGYPLVEGHPLWSTVLKVAFLAALALTVNLTWMVLGSSLSACLSSPIASRRLNVAFAVLLIVSVPLSLWR